MSLPPDPACFDVAIIGYGPVGATLANQLGQAGWRVAVIERETTIYPLPRAIHFDGEVMRIFQNIGLADEVQTVTRPGMKGMHFVNADDRDHDDGPSPGGWRQSSSIRRLVWCGPC